MSISHDPYQTSEKFNENMRRCKKSRLVNPFLSGLANQYPFDEGLTLELDISLANLLTVVN